jgi:Flavodoxin-like fold
MRLALAWTDYSLRKIKAQSTKVSDMQHLIVVAHPAEDSFTMGLTRSYAAELEKLGHRQRTCDLYRMGFDPVLTAQELVPVGSDPPARADVVKAQDDIRASLAITSRRPVHAGAKRRDIAASKRAIRRGLPRP